MTERCNCDASCGENRYHDLGSEYCRHREREKRYARAHLSEKQKVLMRHQAEFHQSYKHLAGIFAIPIGTVKSRLSRARAALRAVA